MDVLGSQLTDRARPHRLFGSGLAIALAALALFAHAPAASAAATPARPADSFVGSIGVNTHFYYSDTPYVERFSVVKQRLSELGVRHIRENIAPDDRPDQYRRLRELASAGVKADLILGDPRNGISTLDRMLSTVKSELGGALDAVEGPNEFNAKGVTDWIRELREYQQHLYTEVKSNPALSSLTVIGPSITSWRQADELGDISGMLDVGSVHPYTSKPPETVVSEALERSAQNAGSKPAFTTETGYHTAMSYRGSESFLPVSEGAQAVYVPRAFLEGFRRGVARTYSYEMLDEFPDPRLTDRESNFGLLRNDLSKKPAFDSLRNLIEILKDPGSGFNPGALDFSLEGNKEGLQQVLLQKRDGSFYLALWRNSSVWDPISQTALNPPSPAVSLNFRQPISEVQVYTPNASSSAQRSVSNPTSPLSVEVGPKVQVIHIVPGEADSAPAEEAPPAEPEAEPPGGETESGTEVVPDEPVSTPTETTPEPTDVTASEEPAPAPAPTPAPEGESTEKHGHRSGGGNGGGGGKGRKHLALWTNRRSVKAGQRLTLHGRVIAARRARSTRVVIQRWHGHWRTVGRGHASASGFFGKRITLRARGRRVARFRLIAPASVPSRPIKIRVLG